jgi:outer membrane immunogenic protein
MAEPYCRSRTNRRLSDTVIGRLPDAFNKQITLDLSLSDICLIITFDWKIFKYIEIGGGVALILVWRLAMNSVLTYTLQMRETHAPKKIRASAIAVHLAMVSSSAPPADLPRAPIQQLAPIAPAWSWTGFYIGINGGGGIGTDSNSDVLFPALPNPPSAPSDGRRALPGGLVGGQIGYNWQLNPNWLFGVEADGQWTSQRVASNVAAQNVNGVGNSVSYTDDERIRSMATARGRFGWIRDSFLWYVTGGGAWADVKNDYTLISTFPAMTFPSPTVASFSTTKSGWTIGGGVETHLGGNWTAKLEYLFVDFGSLHHTFTSLPAPPTFALFDATHGVQDHIIRAGVNYKFW